LTQQQTGAVRWMSLLSATPSSTQHTASRVSHSAAVQRQQVEASALFWRSPSAAGAAAASACGSSNYNLSGSVARFYGYPPPRTTPVQRFILGGGGGGGAGGGRGPRPRGAEARTLGSSTTTGVSRLPPLPQPPRARAATPARRRSRATSHATAPRNDTRPQGARANAAGRAAACRARSPPE